MSNDKYLQKAREQFRKKSQEAIRKKFFEKLPEGLEGFIKEILDELFLES